VSALPFILLAQIAILGSISSAHSFLARHSPLRPARQLAEPGELLGRWGSRMPSPLVFRNVPPSLDDQKSEPGYYGFTEDFFEITLPKSKVKPLAIHSTYGGFLAYPIDVDGDGRDELFIEYGENRGMSVYVCYLAVYALVDDRWWPILEELPLNGYLDGMLSDGDPPAWSRTYSLTRIKRRVVIDLRLNPPPEVPQYIGSVASTEAMQFRRLRYEYNMKRRTYELTDFSFRRIP
jgi:hypothetical protein